MDLNLSGRNALVCGGSQGLGAASAMELAKIGATVTLVARNPERLNQTLLALSTAQGQQHDILIADFSEGETVLKEKIDSLLLKKNIHILVNNSGSPRSGPLKSAMPDDFREAYQNHLITSFSLANWLKEGMVMDGYGRIINIISTSVRQPVEGLAVSNVTRSAMASWAKVLSQELAPMGITVNNVLPGTTRTNSVENYLRFLEKSLNLTSEEVEARILQGIPFGRLARTEEIGAVIAFLASPAASYITGASIPVDGGKIKSI